MTADSIEAHEGEGHFAQGLADNTARLCVDLADVAGHINAVHKTAQQQAADVATLTASTEQLSTSAHTTAGACADASEEVRAAVAAAERAGTAASTAQTTSEHMAEEATTTRTRLENLRAQLEAVAEVAGKIQQIAAQTNLLALNATIEAARAGDAGAGFAVVAGEVKALASETKTATEEIDTILDGLTTVVGALENDSDAAASRATANHAGVEEIAASMASIQSCLGTLDGKIASIAEDSSANEASCAALVGTARSLAAGSKDTADRLTEADRQVFALLDTSEETLASIASRGLGIDDERYIAIVVERAQMVAHLFEAAVADGALTLADLFDRDYQPIPGTDPQQFMTRYIAFTDRVLPDIQEPVLALDERIAFCAAVDVNGFLPTHNLKYNHAQGDDPVWNAANSHNRRLFNDRTGLMAGKSTTPFRLQTYRRDMGGGTFVLMKDVSAPIHVNGHHWGGFRMGYKPTV